jgi:transposase
MHAGPQASLDDELIEQLARLVRAGNYLESAASSCGVTLRQLQSWLAQGHDPAAPPRFRKLRETIDGARADAEARNVAIIANAARDHWQAAAWLLERQYPERWARASQRGQATSKPETATKSDPLAELDELATRRRHA